MAVNDMFTTALEFVYQNPMFTIGNKRNQKVEVQMRGYNKMFDLTPDDLALIENALRDTQSRLSAKSAVFKDPEVEEALRETHELLGRLHNQKKFYRPKTGASIGG